MSNSDVTNYMAGMNLHELGMLHAAYYTYNCFKEAVEREKNERVKEVLVHVCMLFGIDQVNRFPHALIEGDLLSPQGLADLNEVRDQIYKALRPNLIGLVDSFAIPDKFLTNALVKGDPYEVNFSLNTELLETFSTMRNKRQNSGFRSINQSGNEAETQRQAHASLVIIRIDMIVYQVFISILFNLILSAGSQYLYWLYILLI